MTIKAFLLKWYEDHFECVLNGYGYLFQPMNKYKYCICSLNKTYEISLKMKEMTFK